MEDNNLLNNPELYGHGCALTALGVGFDAELFLTQTTFPPEVVTAYGKLGFPEEFKNQFAEKEDAAAMLIDATILVLNVSKSGVNAVQHEDAIEFLKKYGTEILRLSRFPNIEQVNLRCVVAEGETFVERHPDELVNLGSECGLTSLM